MACYKRPSREYLKNFAGYWTLGGFPTSSGGLYLSNLPTVIEPLGTDIVLQLGGGTLGHPDGSAAGAKAIRQAIDAIMQEIRLDEYVKIHKELVRALEKWEHVILV
ncbi:MAG TPA: hypothetical protein HA302_02975 [Thermococcaceae archaeon]|nr:hypothetical protein [Thermococcus sp.]HII66978.1 hypothetical protein [Thermococcaceae archaeon]